MKDIAAQIGMSPQVQHGIAMAPTPQRVSGAAYLRMEIPDHRKAIALFQKEAQDGENSFLRNYARETLPVLETHLDLAQKYSGAT